MQPIVYIERHAYTYQNTTKHIDDDIKDGRITNYTSNIYMYVSLQQTYIHY